MKRGFGFVVISLVLVLSMIMLIILQISFVSAGWFSDLFGKSDSGITGNVIAEVVCSSGQKIGDVDGDGDIDDADVTDAQEIWAQQTPFDESCCLDAAADGGNTIGDFDLLTIIDYASEVPTNPRYCPVKCTGGVGDVNDDGVIDNTDVEISINLWTDPSLVPSDISCLDTDSDGNYDNWDLLDIIDYANIGYPSSISCAKGQKIGDVDNDGDIDDIDLIVVINIWADKISKPSDVCCIDTNKDGSFGDFDLLDIIDIWAGGESPGNCDIQCTGELGDINLDGVVNDDDLALVINPWATQKESTLNISCVDTDGNGLINDFELLNLIDLISLNTPIECSPGQKIGDVDGDGVVGTDKDITRVIKTWAKKTEIPLEACCIDFNGDGEVGDFELLDHIDIWTGEKSSPGNCLVISDAVCNPGQDIGDVNGDGTINESDILIARGVWDKSLSLPSDICCIDINQDGNFTNFDFLDIIDIAYEGMDSPGTCEEDESDTTLDNETSGDQKKLSPSGGGGRPKTSENQSDIIQGQIDAGTDEELSITEENKLRNRIIYSLIGFVVLVALGIGIKLIIEKRKYKTHAKRNPTNRINTNSYNNFNPRNVYK